MREWKPFYIAAGIALVLWLLYPSRELGTAPTGGKVITIRYMGPGGHLHGSMVDVISEFERWSEKRHAQNPATYPHVYRVLTGQTATRDMVSDPTRFLVSVAGGEPPDVIWFDRYAVAEWAARNAFEPLDPYIERDLKDGVPNAVNPDDFYEPCRSEPRYGGKTYGIATSVDNRALFYNKDLLERAADDKSKRPILEEAGLIGPGGKPVPPRNWDQLEVWAELLTEYDENGNVKICGFAPNYGNSWLYMYGWMNGGRFLSEDGRTCTLNEPRIVEALEYMKRLYDKMGGFKQVEAFQAGFQSGALDPFIQGRIAMKIDGQWQMQSLAMYGRDLNFGVSAPPLSKKAIADGVTNASWTGGWAAAIPADARHKDAAWEFIRFLVSDRAMKLWRANEKAIAEAEGRVYVPNQLPKRRLNEEIFATYVYSQHEDLLPEKFKEGCRVFNRLLPTAKYRPVTPVGQILWKKHVDSMEIALHGALTPQEALDQGAKEVNKALQRFHDPVAGRPIRSWTWFFILYAVVLVGFVALLYAWDTHFEFRRKLAGLLRLSRERTGGVIEGARGGHLRRQWLGGVLCASPWMIGFIIFGGGPMLFSIVISFCEYDILKDPQFVGLDNYARMATGEDPEFWISLWNTVYMVIGVPLGLAVSLAMALLLNVRIRGVSIWRTFFYLPSIMPMVAASILWIWIFNPQGGPINSALRLVGVDGPIWLKDLNWSKPSLILMGLWGAGGSMIIFLAGLKSINASLYEAASVDGANAWQRFRYITLPQLTPYIFFNLVMGLIHTFQIFTQAFIMTYGGPANTTLFYVYHLFNNAFRYGTMGYASAMAWVLFVIVLALTVVQMRLSKRWVHYEAETG